MENSRRAAGFGLLAYGSATAVAFFANGAPGGSYSDRAVVTYIERGHWLTAFAFCYLGGLGALGLLFFGVRWRTALGSAGDLLWGLTIAGSATSVAGWFLNGGVVVSMAEGGLDVQSGVPHPVVYTLTETGNLLAVCAPAFFLGTGAILMAVRSSQPKALRVFSVLAGICGILAPLFFTYGVYVLWTWVFSAWLIAPRRRPALAAQPQPSLT